MKKKIFVFIIMFIMVFIPGIFLLTGCGETQKPYIISIEKTMTDGLEDTYTITYSDETTSFFVVTNGKDGIQGIKGESGKDGHTPIITIGPNGNWFIDNIDTKISAKGIDGKDGRDGVGIKSIVKTSTDGLIDTYTITYTDNTTSTFEIVNGQDGVQGIQGIAGKDGIGIELANINDKGNLILKLSNNTSLDLGKITGDAGVGIEKIEKTNSVDNIDNYRIVFSDGKYFDYSIVNGKDGKNGTNGKDGIDGKDGVSIVSILKTSSEENVDTYTITYSNNETSTFKITNGLNGEKGDKGETGNGIVKIEKENTQNNIDTYKILFTDGTSTSFTITNGTNGRGIDIIAKTSSDGLIDTYTINYTDGTYTTYTVTNGSNGLSAYEIYKIYNPDYDKTEQEWILDLVNGDLATKTYTVSFNSDGGNNIPAQTGIKYAGKATKPTDPVKEGYEFAGWYYEDEKWSFIGYSVTENITLVAKWNKIVKISYELNGGINNDLNKTSFISSDEILYLFEPTKQEYVFYGWYDNANFDGEKIVSIDCSSESDIKLYAKWVFQINDVADLLKIVNNQRFWSSEIHLEKSIDLSGIEWNTIGNTSVPFTGQFFGNGYEIRNMEITKSSTLERNYGFIGVSGQNCKIENLKIVNAKIDYETSSTFNVGILVANANNKIIINKSLVTGTISIKSSFRYGYCGGLVGRCNQQGNIITNSYSDVSIMSETYGNNTTGGLIGSLNGGQVSYCYSVGEINAISTTQKVSVGGLIGKNVVTESITQIDNCFAIGNINITAGSDDSAVFGGLIVSGPTTTNSFTSAEQNIIVNNSKTEDKNSNYEIISKQEIIDYCRNNWDSNNWNLSKISGLPDLY